MRTILFRGKNQDGEWVCGHLTQFHYPDNIKPPLCWIWSQSKDLETVKKQQVDHNTLGQFTGLFDKRGVRIFEGDKLLIEWVGKDVTEQRGAVFWNTERHKWDCDTATFPSKNWRRTKVIGNIYSK